MRNLKRILLLGIVAVVTACAAKESAQTSDGSGGSQVSGGGLDPTGPTSGGGGTSPETCGDTICSATEDCSLCPVDCGSCPPTEVHVDGGSCEALQNGLDQAADVMLPLRLSGSFAVDCTLRIPADVQVDAAAAVLNMTKTGRFRNKTQGAAGGYSHAGGFVWSGGTFVGAGDTIFTISHAPSFTIANTIQYAYAEAGDLGHSIEVNASGGPHTPGTYTVQIVDNIFLGVTSQRANSNDEAVQIDFSWSGSGGDAPFDDTMTHNVRIAGNTFNRFDDSGTWEFALCAIGGHRGSAGEPAQRHNGLLIENNTIFGAVGATANVSPDKGAIALWNVRDVWIRNNAFVGCTPSRLVSAWDANPNRALNDMVMNINISDNTHDGEPVSLSMPSTNTTGG